MFQIDLKSRIPIYTQIVDNFKRLIISGVIIPDEKAPSVRDLAQELMVNPNTVQKAYRELETQGYFYTVPGQGNFIGTPDGKREVGAHVLRLKEVIAELAYRGVTLEEMVAYVKEANERDKNK